MSAERAPAARRALRIAFLRPRLGIGGAERLVLDAARELRERGHEVVLFVAGGPEALQFDELASAGFEVRHDGAWLPGQVAGGLTVPCGMARTSWAAFAVARARPPFDVVFCDVVPQTIPLVKRVSGAKVVYYVHFPDRLLVAVGSRSRPLYRLYRAPLDHLEEAGLRTADAVLVNSRYTAEAFRRTFPRLADRPFEVLHPPVEPADGQPVGDDAVAAPGKGFTILCVSRFAPGKDLHLAIEALLRLRETLPPEAFADVRLVLAGHEAPADHGSTTAALERRADEAGLGRQVSFVRSPSDRERRALLAACSCVLYTPAEEHFGYVPLEAMAAGRPVVASSRGGPAETVLSGITGLLCDATAEGYAAALASLLADRQRARAMGARGREHVARCFSRAVFGDRLERVLLGVVPGGEAPDG